MGQHGKHWPLVIAKGLILGLVLMTSLPAKAAACRLALILALDVSASVDFAEDRLQRAGLAAALIAPEVKTAFFQSPDPVALAVFEWSGRNNQKLLLDWTLIESPVVLSDVAEILGHSKRSTSEFATALGYSLGYAATLMRRAPSCLTQTIDVSGDGHNNDGFTPRQAYAHFPFAGVTVNGLVIETEGAPGATQSGIPDKVADYYRQEVLFGPGAFLEIADGFDDYERAMRRKLERELSALALSSLTPAR